MKNKDTFASNGYCVIRNAIPVKMAEIAGSALLLAEQSGHLSKDTQQVFGATCIHGYPLMEVLMIHLIRLLEENTGLSLIPTYSFARIYRKGDTLVKHVDRQSCEISATLTLTYKAAKVWPIFVEAPDGTSREVPLDKGDLMVYRGIERPHWREPFDGEMWIQVFVHYIDADGSHRASALDKRPNLGRLYMSIRDQLMNGERHDSTNE